MAEQKLRIAILGCGRISVNHLEAIQSNSDRFKLVAVCDIILEKAMDVAQKMEVEMYSSFEEMLNQGNIDVVSLCTPSGLHPEQAIMAAQKGVHVISEKPMATNLKAANEMIDVCDQFGVKLFVVKQNRLNSTLQLVKKTIEKQRFGQIYMIAVNVFWQRPQSYYDVAPWRGTWEYDGGAFMNQASHYVDMMEWLIGDVDKVCAMTSTMARKIEAEDTGSAILRFKNGAIGNMNVTMLTYPKNLSGSLTILGEKGTVIVGGTSVNRIDHWEFSDQAEEDTLISTVNYSPPSVYGFGHTGYYKNVADVLLEGAIAETNGKEGRKSLEVILAIYESARKGTEISLPLIEF
jgi:UDP-N-acetyl-2-amino-2-deoxyglucuronate dehydrogenase